MNLIGYSSFDELLAYNCSPVLLGIKPSNLISFPHGDAVAEKEFDDIVASYNEKFATQEIIFKKLCYCNKRILLLVYKEKEIEKIIQDDGYQACLVAMGYPKDVSVAKSLAILQEHLQAVEEFPHEIGVFLGYPLEDILGFIINRGQNCKYSGYWKVYGDVKAAQKLFALYEYCRDTLLQKVAAGIPLHTAVSMV